MTKFKFAIIFLIGIGSAAVANAGNIDLLWNGDEVHGVKSYTLGIGFSDDITDELGLSGYYRKGKKVGVVTKDEGELDLHYNPTINDKWSLWLDERARYNKMLGIDFENDLGVGLKYYVYKQKETKFSLSSGVLYQYTVTSNREGRGRYSHLAKFKNNSISLIYFYQPNISDSSDYITKFIGDVKLVEIKENISVLLHYKNEYRSLSGRSENSGIKLRIEY